MSLSVALQSVLFYVVACTPCAKVRHRQKARKQAKKDRAEKAKFDLEQPDMYRHPDPFSTNPYWTEEIMMGPSLPKKGRVTADASKNTSQRGLTSAGQDSGIGTRSSLAISNAGTPVTDTANTTKPPDQEQSTSGTASATPGSARSTPESGTTAIELSPGDEPTSPSRTLTQTASVSTGDDWNHKRYQREDEELWGHGISRTGQQLMDAIKQAGTSAGRFVEAKLGMEKQVTDQDRHAFYFTPKNPPVNDYHPPVVSSRPAKPDGHRWMLQPPPSAKVMEGRVPVSRSGSIASMASRRTAATTDSHSLGRMVGERAVEAKIRKGEAPPEAAMLSSSTLPKSLTRKPTTASSRRSRSQRTVRSRSHSLSTESDSSPTEGARQSRRRPRARARPPVAVDSDDEDEWIANSIESLTKPNIPSTHAAQRPRLSTILSSDQCGTATTSRALQDITTQASNTSKAPAVSSGSKDTAITPSISLDSGVVLHD
jgi:hypothetical protein